MMVCFSNDVIRPRKYNLNYPPLTHTGNYFAVSGVTADITEVNLPQKQARQEG